MPNDDEKTQNSPAEAGETTRAQAPSAGDLVASGMAQLQALFRKLVVVEHHSIEDYWGNRYEFPTKLKGRRALRAAVELWDIVSGVDGQGKAVHRLVEFIRAAVLSEENDDRLQVLFQTLHPKALKAAQQAARDAGEEDCVHVLDLFEVDQVFEALIPFLTRYAARLAAAWRRGTGQPPEASTSAEPSHTTPSAPSERSLEPYSPPVTT